MSKWPLRIGYGFLAATLLIAIGSKLSWWQAFGPLPAPAAAIICGAIGLMLVITDRMVRLMIGQSNALAAQEAQGAQEAQEAQGAQGAQDEARL